MDYFECQCAHTSRLWSPVEERQPNTAWTWSKGAFTPKTREFTRSTIRRLFAKSVETLCEGRGLSLCLVSVKTIIISFIHHGISNH